MSKHIPLRVYSASGMLFVQCSCSESVHPQSAIWLKKHFKGTTENGIQVLREVVAKQEERHG